MTQWPATGPARHHPVQPKRSIMEFLSDPIQQFSSWYEQVKQAAIDKPNAMSLATVDNRGRPYIRIVLLSSFDDRGLVFHTNYNSRKGQDIAANPQVAVSFWWDDPGYQVHINGVAEKTSDTDSDAYFASRPRGSQLGAWASEQSHVIENRATLEKRLKQFEEKYRNTEVPRPPHWGGYRIKPDTMEFWINGADRLHDRFLYTRNESGNWSMARLAP